MKKFDLYEKQRLFMQWRRTTGVTNTFMLMINLMILIGCMQSMAFASILWIAGAIVVLGMFSYEQMIDPESMNAIKRFSTRPTRFTMLMDGANYLVAYSMMVISAVFVFTSHGFIEVWQYATWFWLSLYVAVDTSLVRDIENEIWDL